jgi:hypothetical protein
LPMTGFDNNSLAVNLFKVRLLKVYEMVWQMNGVAVHWK